MGRIKTDMVKRTGNKIYKADTKKFSTDFNKNKKALDESAEVRSKKLRNVIAGHITRLAKVGDALPRRPKAAPVERRGPGRFPRK